MFFRINPFVFIVLSAGILSAESDLAKVSETLRDYYLRKAKVWHQTEIRTTDILAGPQSKIAVPPEQQVTCQYIEPKGDVEGYAPKFRCKLSGSNEIVLVKYKSRETGAEVAATRLLWALGFYTDENYPVRLKCLSCPAKDAFRPSEEEPRVERIFDDAIIEKNFPGEIGEYEDQGWNWEELDQVQEASKAEVDALKLLAVFIQHTDSKQEQQRLGCYSQDIVRQEDSVICKKPVLMVQDLGATVGQGAEKVTSQSAMNFQGWKSQNIWKQQSKADNPGQATCYGNLTSAEFAWRKGFSDPEISEAGRQFLANLLNQLSDQQIHDLFRVARADKTGEMIDENGRKRRVTIQDWVQLFKEKRRQINDQRCR